MHCLEDSETPGGEGREREREEGKKELAQWSELDRYFLTLEDPQGSANPDVNGSPSGSTACSLSLSHRYSLLGTRGRS